MIQANELRIGNIYNRKHGKGWTETVMSEEIIGKIFGNSKEYALNDFEPIPLTEEILFKAGFVKQGMAYIISVPKKFHVTKWSDGRFMYDGFLNTEIKHVHQLQNLYFALTGEELPINL